MNHVAPFDVVRHREDWRFAEAGPGIVLEVDGVDCFVRWANGEHSHIGRAGLIATTIREQLEREYRRGYDNGKAAR